MSLSGLVVSNYPLSGAPVHFGSLWRPFDLDSERFWAVGCAPARLAHRIVGEWPGNHAMQSACGSSICLHAEFNSGGWPFPSGGLSFNCIEEIPEQYKLCLKCVEKDDTVA